MTFWKVIDAERGGNGGNGGQGGEGGDAGHGGQGGTIFFRTLDPGSRLPKFGSDACAGGRRGVRGNNGFGGDGGPAGAGGSGTDVPVADMGGGRQHTYPGARDGEKGTSLLGVQRTSASGEYKGWWVGHVPPDTPLPVANAGMADVGHGKRTAAGAAGGDPEYARIVREARADLASYLEMELQRARFRYLSLRVPTTFAASDDDATRAVTETSERLQWVLDRARAVLDGPAGTAPAPHLESLHARASAFWEQLMTGLDYFGHRPDWVPTLTLDYYESRLRLLVGAGLVHAGSAVRL